MFFFNLNIYRRHFRQSVVKTPLHPFYLHLILYYLYIRLFYTHSLYTLFTLCIIHYYHFVCILRLHPCAKRLCSFQSQFIVYLKQVYKCCDLSREVQFEGLHSSRLHVRSSPAFLMVSQKLSYASSHFDSFDTLDMGVHTPFFFHKILVLMV